MELYNFVWRINHDGNFMVVEKMEYIVVCGGVYLDIDFSIELLGNVTDELLCGAFW